MMSPKNQKQMSYLCFESHQNGQATILSVVGLSLFALTLIFSTVSRVSKTREFVLLSDARIKGRDALNEAIKRLYKVYQGQAGCDPGLFAQESSLFSSVGSRSYKIIPVDLPKFGSSLSTETHLVQIQRMRVLERNDLAGVLSQEIRFPSSSGGASLVPLSLTDAHEAKLSGGGYVARDVMNGENPMALGRSDLELELAVAFPVSRPTFLQKTKVIFIDTCSRGYRRDLPSGNSQNRGSTSGPHLPLSLSTLASSSFLSHKCSSNGNFLGVHFGGSGSSIDSDSLNYWYRFLQEGTLKSIDSSTALTTRINCADINRDGIFDESDLGYMQKLVKGYVLDLPPVYPDYLGGSGGSSGLQKLF